MSTSTFQALGLSSDVLSALEFLKIEKPTPIQAAAIPEALTGTDLIGLAQTGTGKTFAFGLPILGALIANPSQRALILVPTRELALQVEESLQKIARATRKRLSTISLIGGASMYNQIERLKKFQPQLIVATPGRLNDHLERRTIKLDAVKFLVLDEADRMLDMGFTPQVNRIVEQLPADRQTMLFSATMSPAVTKLSASYLKSPERIEVAQQGTSSSLVTQELYVVGKEQKRDALLRILKEHTGSVLVFTRTKHATGRLSDWLESAGESAAPIHGDRSLGQRRAALDGFKSGRTRVLVATDVAARGIDVTGIALVVNFDLPDAAEDYVHRIGRTGRAGREGVAISLATRDQERMVRDIERLMRKPLERNYMTASGDVHKEAPRALEPVGARPAAPRGERTYAPKPYHQRRPYGQQRQHEKRKKW